MDHFMEKLVLGKAITSKEAKACRELVKPGKYDVRFDVHMHGTVSVGEDGFRAPTVKILSLPVLALVLHNAGITGQAALNAIARAFDEAERLDGDAKEKILEVTGVKKAIDRISAGLISRMAPIPTKGQVRARLDIEFSDSEIKTK